MSKIGEMKNDVRVIDWSLRRGITKHSDYDKMLKSLPDDAENAIEVRPGDEEYEAAIEAEIARKKAEKEAAAAVSEE